MSRINEIQDQILDAVEASADLSTLEVLTDNEETNLNTLTSTSRLAQWRLVVWVVAFAFWVEEQLLEVLRTDIESRIAETRPFTKGWYTTTSLLYQHGFDLPESGVYSTPNTSTEIQAVNGSKIIKKASVVQAIISGVGSLRVKVATLNGGELEPITGVQLNGFQEYIELMGAAGVYIIATSTIADDLKLVIDVHFNALILDNEGKRLDGTNDTPVQNAVKSFLKDVDFDGEIDLVRLSNVLEAVEGVVSPFINLAASKYASFTYESDAVSNVGVFTKFRQPDSGYFKLDEAESQFNFIES
jgi:hypothetical protein